MSIIEDIKWQYKIGDVAMRLILWNILLFAVPEVVFALLKLFNINADYIHFISLSTDLADLKWKPWSLLTYAFFHFGIMHLIFNMLMLFFSSRLFLTFFTQKQLLGVYILSAVFSGIIFLLGYFYLPTLSNVQTSMIGASGAIMAVLIATATYQPLMEVRLALVGTVKLWQIAIVLLLIDLIQLPMNNSGGHIAHLSGAFFGFFYIRLLQNGTDLSRIVTEVIRFFTSVFDRKPKSPFRKVHVNPRKPVMKRESRIVAKDKTQQQIDEILDKISQSGYDSLTKEEKEFLFKAGK